MKMMQLVTKTIAKLIANSFPVNTPIVSAVFTVYILIHMFRVGKILKQLKSQKKCQIHLME